MRYRFKKLTVLKFAICFVIGLSASIASASTITVNNPSFETPGNITDANWAEVGPPWTPTLVNPYQLNNGDNINADNGSRSLLVPNTGLISQNLSTTVNAGDTLSVTFRGGRGNSSSSTNPGGVGIARFTVGVTDYSDTFDTTTLPNNTWATFTLTKTITNTGNLTLKFDTFSGSPWLDTIGDITVTPVPEPSSLVLLLFGGLFFGKFRKASTR